MTQLLDALPSGAMLIGDEWLAETSGGTFAHVNPATGKVQRTVPVAGQEEIDRAVRAARGAFPEWRAFPPDKRRNLLLRLGTLLQERAAGLATTLALENGTPVTLAPLMAGMGPPDNFFYFAGLTEKVEGSVIPVYPGPALDYTLPEPYGVVGIIIPWNGPLGSIAQHAAPALAAGNCIVIKPPDLTPFSPQRFGELALEAGVPPGVVNVVPGGAAAGEALVRHPGIDKISFTGGKDVARQVLVAAAENITPVLLELGGKSASIVFSDADLAVAVPQSVMFALSPMSGQGCILPSRLLVQADVYDAVVDGIGQLAEGLVVGDPLDPATVMGPVISARHCDRILGFVERAKDRHSGRLLTGGTRLGGSLADGYYVAPTVFVDVDPMSELAQEEIFGPVLSVIRFRDEAEAVALANGTPYGLAAYVWTEGVHRAHRVAAQLEAGMIGVNGFPLAPTNAPFGGNKASGFGRIGGRFGLEEFLRVKNVYMPLRPA